MLDYSFENGCRYRNVIRSSSYAVFAFLSLLLKKIKWSMILVFLAAFQLYAFAASKKMFRFPTFAHIS